MHQLHRSGPLDTQGLWARMQAWSIELGFSQIAVADVDLSSAEAGLLAWLQEGFAGDMHYMAAHGLKRMRPAELVPGTVRVITARMDYLPAGDEPSSSSVSEDASKWRTVERSRLEQPQAATVSLYARGRDYHKVLRGRLQQLVDRMAAEVGPFGHRVFTDSAPVAEVELSARSGLGWRGKHTLLLNRDAGSMFFLGEIYVDFKLPLTPAVPEHCGRCSACIDICPTRAIVEPYRLDARRCISYLTIEHEGPIPVELRPLMGNRIYGCDDCQLICPWNKFASRSPLPDFQVRDDWRDPTLLTLWRWSEPEFLRRTEGSAIRRIGYRRWRRNLAVALGNALRELGKRGSKADADMAREIVVALKASQTDVDALVNEHVAWALAQQV